MKKKKNTEIFLQVGNGVSVRTRDIVGIFDLDLPSPITNDFLRTAQKERAVVTACANVPRSFVYTSDELSYSVYLSGTSASTLAKRRTRLQEINNDDGEK